MQKSTSGFTIVELIVIIVVIGIIATIAIVSYVGIQKATLNEQRRTELLGWKATFEKYKAANGQYPAMANGGYCLGTGFPDGKCRNFNSTINVYYESASTGLMAALTPFDPPAIGTRVPVENVTVGPYVDYSTSQISLSTAIASIDESDCPAGATKTWDNGSNRMVCRILLIR